MLENAIEQPGCAAVDGFAADDMVTAPEHLHQGIQTSGAAGEGEAVAASLQCRYVAFKGFARGILAASVLVSFVGAEGVLDVCGRQVDGRHDCPGEGVGALAGVNRPGAKANFHVVIKSAGHSEVP